MALISEALGGLGTIVLIRHPDDLMTTYSTLSNVSVEKGDRVPAGEVIGVVAPRDNPELQFDVFRGTDQRRPDPLPRRADTASGGSTRVSGREAIPPVLTAAWTISYGMHMESVWVEKGSGLNG